MAIQLAYTDPRTNVYAASYWRLTSHQVDKKNKIMRFSFEGYKDAATAASAKTNKTILPVGMKHISISGTAFDTNDAIAVSCQKNLYQIGYITALSDSFFASGQSV